MPIKLPQSPNIKYIVIGILVFAAIVYVGRSCRLGEKIDMLKEQVALQDQVISGLKEDYAKSQTLVAKKESVIQEKDAEIKVYEKKVIETTSKVSHQAQDIKDLENQLTGLTDKDQIIANLKAQVEGWKKQFNLCQEIIAEKDAIIFSLTQKYDAEHEIRINLQGLLEKTRVEMGKMVDDQKALISALEEKAKTANLKFRVSNVLLFAAIAAATFLGVK